MYQCRDCGNRKLFVEHNMIETEVELDEKTGETIWMSDKFIGCAEVVCAVCGASSEDKAILDSESLKPLEY